LPGINVCRANTLPDGTVLLLSLHDIQAGRTVPNVLFDPVDSEITEVGYMATARGSCDFAVVVLADGRALIAGGHENTPPVETDGAEVFD
jgi:hypothetical protein